VVRLPFGWRTTPVGTYTDLYMWQQFLTDPACHAISGARATALNFAGSHRIGWTLEHREAELAIWARQITDPEWRIGFVQDVLDKVYFKMVQFHLELKEAWYEKVRKRDEASV